MMPYRYRFRKSQILEMENADEKVPATNSTESVKTVGQLWIPEFWPDKVVRWFMVLEAQFEYERIVSDKVKFNIIIANLSEQYLKLVENIVINPPATGRYELLKNEFIKKVNDLNNKRVRGNSPSPTPPIHTSDIDKDSFEFMHQLLPSQSSGLRPPIKRRSRNSYKAKQKRLLGKKQDDNWISEFYDIPQYVPFNLTQDVDDLFLLLWKVRLPSFMQRILMKKLEADKAAADKNAADKNAADKNAADKNAADENAADENAADENAADENAADENAVDMTETSLEEAQTAAESEPQN